MPFVADLHIHSAYSRATSREMTPEGIWKWAQLKGVTVVGTGDFTHPKWLRELDEKLEPAGSGLYGLKKEFQNDNGVPRSCRSDVSFLLSVEISCIYRKNGRTRKVHCLVLVPDMTAAARLNAALARIGNITSDGRPILGLDAKELLKMTLDLCPTAMFIPAHAWTPHFSVFGAASGFDSMEECFEEFTPHIFAIETGLSSDPSMNWRLSSLDGMTLISNSDAHSPQKMAREANLFETERSYTGIAEAIRTGRGFLGTIEFFPEEGKYHYDGHRTCGVCWSPRETLLHNSLCRVCGKRLTIGVAHRVEALANREPGFRPPGSPPFRSAIPLSEILGEVLGCGAGAKKVQAEYARLLATLGNELKILLDTPISDIERVTSSMLPKAIERMRQGLVHVKPGYDGEYGRISILEAEERQKAKGQGSLL